MTVCSNLAHQLQDKKEKFGLTGATLVLQLVYINVNKIYQLD